MLTHILAPLKSFGPGEPGVSGVRCHAFVSDSQNLLIATFLESDELLVGFCSKSAGAKLEWISLKLEECVCCMAVSPCAKYVAYLTETGHLKLIETPVKNGSLKLSEGDGIILPGHDKILGTPSSCVWFVSKSERNFVIYSNKGGEMFFLDLQLKKPTISLQAPQSIHALQLVTEISSANVAINNVYLLATGFTGSQWLIPLENGGLSLRETLSSVVPRDLNEIPSTGHVMPLLWRDSYCIAVLRKNTAVVELYHCVSMRNAIVSIPVPPNTVSVLVTDDTVFSMDECNNVTVQHITMIEKSINKPIGKFEGQLFDFIPINFEIDGLTSGNYPLKSALILGDQNAVILKNIKNKLDIFVCMLLSCKEESIGEMCIALCLDLPPVASQVAAMLLVKPNPDINLAFRVCKKAKMQPVDVIRLFSNFKQANFILTNYQNLFDSLKNETKEAKVLQADVVKLVDTVVDVVDETQNYERILCVYRLRSLIHSLAPYLTEKLLQKLMGLNLWSCACEHLKISKIVEFAARRVLLMPEFYKDETFYDFCLNSNFASLVSTNVPLAAEYYAKLLENFDNFTSRKLILDVLLLCNPMREEISALLEKNKRKQLNEMEIALLQKIAALFLQCLVKLVSEFENPAKKNERKRLATSNFHACLISNEALFSWGRAKELHCLSSVGNSASNIDIQLGALKVQSKQNTPAAALYSLPVIVPMPICPSSVTHISCGSEHTVVLTEHGIMYAWGFNRFGQCGLGHSNAVETPERVEGLEGVHIKGVSAGSYHTMAIDATGCMYACGWSVHGQLGLGNIQNDPCTLTRVPPQLLDTPIRTVHCGYAHSLMVAQCGSVYMCGNGTYGQLGNGKIGNQRIPRRVALEKDYKVVLASTGHFHSLTLMDNGELWTWGATPQSLKFKAMLQKKKKGAGQATSPTSASMALASEGLGSIDGEHMTPTRVKLILQGSESVVEMSCGLQHSAVLTDGGKLYMWGKNLECQLGFGDKKERNVPTLLPPVGNTCHWCEVQCGSDFTVAINEHGEVYAWGKNDVCQLGFKSFNDNDKHWASGKTFTFQKGSKGHRTIQLPQDSRVFVQNPTLVPGLRATVTSQGSTIISNRFDYQYLVEAIKIFHGFYGMESALQWCKHEKMKNLRAFILFLHNKFKEGIELQAKIAPEFEAQKSLYASLLNTVVGLNLTEFCEGLAVLKSVYKLTNEQVDSYVTENLHGWRQGLAYAIKTRHKISEFLKPATKVEILKMIVSSENGISKKTENGKLVINLSQISTQEQFLYLFPDCGHNLPKSAVLSEIGELRNDSQLNNRFSELFSICETDLSNYPANLCPSCIKSKLVSAIN